MAEKKLSKKALNKSFRNWFYGHLTCFSQEHMQTFGYLCAMLPLVEELYDTREEQTEALKTYSAFFNTEPQLGTVIVGMTAGLEEAKANGEDIDGEMINGIRAGLMGPVAGIGDSLGRGTIITIIIVMFILPQILLLGEKVIDKTSFDVPTPVSQHQSSGRVRIDGMVRGEIRGQIHGIVHAYVDGDVNISLLSGQTEPDPGEDTDPAPSPGPEAEPEPEPGEEAAPQDEQPQEKEAEAHEE